MKNIIKKIRDLELKGRGGGDFETWKKWDMVTATRGDKYIICNGADGEILVSKDGYILENYLDYVIEGINIAIDTVKAKKAYFYLREDYYEKHLNKILSLGNDKIEVFKKPDVGYIGGEETVICEIIEGRSAFPRRKPPYLTEKGLFGCPTLINNIETFYCVAKIFKNEYQFQRFYSVCGDVKNSGVFELANGLTIREILEKTNNLPKNNYFLRVGGNFGSFLSKEEIDIELTGLGVIEIFEIDKTNPIALIEKMADFFHKNNCDKCVPCREGFLNILEMVKSDNLEIDKIRKIIFGLENYSFCFFGKGAGRSLGGLFDIILNGEHYQRTSDRKA